MSRPITLAMLIGLVTLGNVALRHNDDSDSQLYSVVARNMVQDGAWFDLRYAGNVHPQFREHLPFGLWPGAIAWRLGGLPAVTALSCVWSLLTLALTAFLARKLSGSDVVAALAVFFLATTEQFVITGAVHRLDNLLVMLALAATVPSLVDERPTVRGWLVTFLCVFGATCVKGPFGLVPIAAAGLARAIVDRRWTWLFWAGTASLLGTVGVVAFLWNAYATGSDWWSGYALHQLSASASGTRLDGDTRPLVPLVSLAEHFWPWLPLVAVSFWRAVKEPTRAQRLIGWTGGLALAFLFLPSRKLWHHTLLLYPFLCVAIALAVTPWFEKWSPRIRALAIAVPLLGALAVINLMPRTRANVCTDFIGQLGNAHGRILVQRAESAPYWKEISTIALETPLEPWLVADLSEARGDWALVAKSVTETPTGWVEIAVGSRWRLLRRAP